ncbi:MAG TPA: hypothetical protein VF246_05905 [Acidimicrobiia bacterium]
MRVRCGACRTQFEVSGAGRFACPVCGSVNVVRGADGPQNSGMGGYPQGGPEPPPPPLPRVTCPQCEFSFVVGQIAVATCPNCNAEVPTGQEVDESAQ